jgi:membrane associated rhomboid family serine protease
MQLVAQLLRSLFDLAMFLMGLLGMRGSRWEWKKSQWKMSLESKLASWEMTERGVRAKVRMCRHCRELVDRSLTTCPACGASMRDVPRGGIGRLFAAVLPQFSSLTTILITANVFILAIQLMTWDKEPPHGFFSILSPVWQAQFVFGAKWPGTILQLHQYWRVVTAGFLHGGIIHLALNCYALSILGPLIEEAFGWRKFLLIYLVSDIGSFAVSTLFSPRSSSVGASGAIFGLLGFGVIFARFRAGPRGKAVSDQLMRWILPGVLMLFLPGIDNAAHAGGFACGALLALVIDPGEPHSAGGRRVWAVLTALSLAILIGAFVAMLMEYPTNVELLRR